jgi:serine/threonine-protein kinase
LIRLDEKDGGVIGGRIGPYAIQAKLGEGGMGDVYRATDTRLGRTVAIKRLKPSHVDRFRREALAIAALNHPHICTLYDIGDDYLVMEYVDGAPLRGPYPPAEATALALQIASALEAAHARGIVHRDLKPANILVGPGGVKLLDFGLAMMAGSGSHSSGETVAATQAGTVLGTAGYMSPEQAVGRPADARSDVFAFGAVVYEMLSGRAAFDAETFAGTVGAVLHGEPAPLDAPPPLREIVARCLRKRPDDRFPTMTAVRQALEATHAGALPGDSPASGASIAVLPFANLSGDKDNEYFSDGLAEEILNALARVPGLKVTARTSSFAFRGREQDVRRIAEALGVTSILEGSVRRAGSRIRVVAQLINAADGYHLWSDRYDRELTDVFAVQDEIAAAIAGALQVTLAPGEAAPARYIPPLEAYELFLRGRHLFAKQTASSVERAIECYEQAAALDPRYPDPHVELAAAYMIRWYHGLQSAREMVPLILKEVRLGQHLGRNAPRANGLLGIVAAVYEHDQARALQYLETALRERVGAEAEARWCYAIFHLVPQGRFDEALALFAPQTADTDPLNVVWRGAVAYFLNLAGRHEEAIAHLRELFAIDRGYWVPHLYMAECCVMTNRWSEARAAAEEAHRLAPWSARVAGMLAAVLQQAGESERAAELLGWLHTTAEEHQRPPGLVLYHCLRGEVEQALDWYERAIEQRDICVFVQSRAWLTRHLREHPRWPAIAAAMGL